MLSLTWDLSAWNNSLWGPYNTVGPAQDRVVKVETVRAIDQPVMYILHLRGGA